MLKKYFPFFLILFISVNSCAAQPQKFDSEKWKSGSESVRGSMVEDIKNSEILQDKTETQIKELLGKPDDKQGNLLSYEVKTLSRCYFWECRMEIQLDSQTEKKFKEVGVSD